jgi:hypothetical protein
LRSKTRGKPGPRGGSYPPDQGLPGRPCARATRAALPNLTAGEHSPENGGAVLVQRRDRMSLRSLTSRPVTGIPNGPRPPPGWFPEPEDARPSAPGSNPGRAGRALTIRGGNGSHTPRPGVQIRAAASVRSESSRNGIAPGPTTLVSVPSRGAPHHPRSSLRGVGRARRRGLSARGTRGLRSPFPLRVTGPLPREAGPLPVRDHTGHGSVEWRRFPSRDQSGDHPPGSVDSCTKHV